MSFISKEFDDTYGLVLEISEDKSYYIVKDFKREVLHSDEVYIPETFGGLPVCEIAPNAFHCGDYNEKFSFKRALYIPKTIKKIGYDAFHGMTIAKVHIEDIASWCEVDMDKYSSLFYENGEFKAKLYEGDAPIENLVIPEGVKKINSGAFAGCEFLSSVTIPASVERIGKDAFFKCEGLKAVNITDIVSWCNIDFEGENSNPLVLAHDLYLNGEKQTSILFPITAKEIKRGVFEGCSVEKIEMHEGLERICENAFKDCKSLLSIAICSTCSIARGILSGCTALTTLSVPFIGPSRWEVENTTAGIGDNHLGYFFGALTYANNPQKVPKTLTSVKITAVSKIGQNAFYGCESVKEVTIFKCVEKVCYASFLSCKYLKSVIYLGSKKEWKKIDFTKENKNLLKAKITFLE